MTSILAAIILVGMKVFSREALRKRRGERSARSLSKAAGLGGNTVAAIESGQIGSPTAGVLEKLARELDCDPTDFYVEPDDIPEAPDAAE